MWNQKYETSFIGKNEWATMFTHKNTPSLPSESIVLDSEYTQDTITRTLTLFYNIFIVLYLFARKMESTEHLLL